MKNSKKECDVSSCFLCKLCFKEWMPAIATHRRNFNVRKGEEIFREGDVVAGVYFVYEGTVKVHKRWGDEKELILRFARKGAILGHRGLGSDLVYPVSATALEGGTVCYIDLDFFNTTLKVNNHFTYELMMFFADELRESEKKMRDLAHMPVKGRLAQALLTLKQQFGVTNEGYLDLELSRQDLAAYAGATYETLFRNINELVNEGFISLQGKKVHLKNEQGLIGLTRPATSYLLI